MPADDLVLNVRQISGYPNLGIEPTDNVLVQRGGIGGPYLSVSAQQFVGQALADGGPMSVGNPAPADTASPQLFTDGLGMVLEGQLMWNTYVGGGQEKMVGPGPGGRIVVGNDGGMVFQYASPTGPQTLADFVTTFDVTPEGYMTVADQILLARDPAGPLEAATAQFVERLVTNLQNSVVWTFNGRVGPVRLWLQDILAAGGAPQFSPVFGGEPRAPTPSPWSCNSRIATTAFAQRLFIDGFNHMLADHPFVFSFNGRSGDVVLTPEDIAGADAAFTDSPAFTGVPTAPTAPFGTDTTQISTTAFVQTAVSTAIGGLGGVYAPISSPAFQGTPTALTAAPGTSTGQLATTAFVMNAVADSVAGVSTFNGRSGNVTLEATDLSDVGGALTASPVFTGTPTAPNAIPGVNTNQIATCAWVLQEIGGSNVGVMSFNGRGGAVVLNTTDITQAGGAALNSPVFTGGPQAPTAPTGDSSDQIANTAFVMSALTANAGVVSFNSRTGAITLTTADVSAAGGAPIVSPAFSGSPTAPTPAPSDNSTRLATTAYVSAALAGILGVASFNGRTGAVTLTSADLSTAAVGGPFLPLSGGNLTGTLTVPAGGAAPWSGVTGPPGSTRMWTGMTNGVLRWAVLLGNGTAESGGNAGSDFNIWRYNDAGAGLGAVLSFTRSTGAAAFSGDLSCANINMGGALSGCTNINAATVGQIGGCTFSGNNAIVPGTVTAQTLTANGSLTAPGATIGGVTFQGSGNFVTQGTLTLEVLSVTNTVLINAGATLNYSGVIAFTGGNIQSANNGASCGIAGAAFFQCAAYNFAQQSDARSKRDITLAPPGALGIVQLIPVHNFFYRSEQRPTGRRIGWLAQEVQMVAPSNVLVGEDADQTLAIELGSMCATLWEAVQELTARVATLEAAA